MARNYPADTKLQAFITEGYENEAFARQQAFLSRKRGAPAEESGYDKSAKSQVPVFPRLTPGQFAIKQKREEDAAKAALKEEARQIAAVMKTDMYPVDEELKKTIYDGLSHHEEGRYNYLYKRHRTMPDTRFTYPCLKSMEYGWKIADEYKFGRPAYGRSRYESDFFYRNNGVPTLPEPQHFARRPPVDASLEI